MHQIVKEQLYKSKELVEYNRKEKIQYNRKECWVEAAPATTSGTQSARQEGPDIPGICRIF